MDHDFADLHLAKVKNAVQHCPFLLNVFFIVLVFAGVKLDRPAKLLGGGTENFLGVIFDTEHLEDGADDEIDDRRDWCQHIDQDVDRRGDVPGCLVGVPEGVGLGQNFGENQDQRRHGDGRIGDPGIAEQRDQHARRQGRGHDVDQVVAEQNGADQPFLVFVKTVDDPGAVVAVLLQLMHQRPGGGRQRGFRAGKEGRQDEQDGNDDNGG